MNKSIAFITKLQLLLSRYIEKASPSRPHRTPLLYRTVNICITWSQFTSHLKVVNEIMTQGPHKQMDYLAIDKSDLGFLS